MDSSAEDVQRLLALGADVHADDDYALRQASAQGHLAVVEALLGAGADVHAENDEALRKASEYGRLDVVQALLHAGADVHARKDWALRWASSSGHVAVVEVLLAAGADVHANNDGALRLASEEGHVVVVEILVRHGARPHTVLRKQQPLRTFLLLSISKEDARLLDAVNRHAWCRLRARLRLRLRRFWYDKCVPRLEAPPHGVLVQPPTEEQLVAYLATGGRRFARHYWEMAPTFFPTLVLGVCPF